MIKFSIEQGVGKHPKSQEIGILKVFCVDLYDDLKKQKQLGVQLQNYSTLRKKNA